MVTWLLEHGADPGQDRSRTPVTVDAGRNAQPAILRLLLAKGAPVDARTSGSGWGCARTALHVVMARESRRGKSRTRAELLADHNDVIDALLEGGADPTARDGGGLTPLHVAASEGFVEGAAHLLEASSGAVRCRSWMPRTHEARQPWIWRGTGFRN
jgi:ankyrin repeat protein